MAIVLLTWGCTHADASIAAAIERARPEVVERAVYEPATFIDQAIVKVYVKPGTPEAEAVALACEVVEPMVRAERQDPYLVWGVYPADGGVSYWREDVCDER